MSSISAPGNTSNRAYSFKPRFSTDTYPIFEAIDLASKGILTPGDVYSQLPSELSDTVDKISKHKFDTFFLELPIRDQCAVFQILKTSNDTSTKDKGVDSSISSNKIISFFQNIFNTIKKRQ